MDKPDADKLRSLVLKRFQCGKGNREHITTLLSQKKDMESTDYGTSSGGNVEESEANFDLQPKPTNPNQPQWCICGNCVEMPREIENKCFAGGPA